MRRRTEAENVDEQPLVVPCPAIRQESAFAHPSMGDRRLAVAGPIPIRAAVQRVRQRADFFFLLRVLREVLARGQHSREEKRRVDRGEFASQKSFSRLHVEEVIVEAFVACGVGRRTLRTVPKESQRRERQPPPQIAVDEAAFDADRISGQRQPDGGDAGRRAVARMVRHQAVGGIVLIEEILERLALQIVQSLFVERHCHRHAPSVGCCAKSTVTVATA
jgi:hypothetical protein